MVRFKKGAVRQNPSDAIVFPNGSIFIPTGPFKWEGWKDAEVRAVYKNPVSDFQRWGSLTKAVLFIGLETGRVTTNWPTLHTPYQAEPLYGWVFEIRTEQVGPGYGGSFVSQKGHYIPEEDAKVYKGRGEQAYRENSVQVILFPAPSEPWEDFQVHVSDLAKQLVELFAQKSIVVEWTHEGVVESVGSFEWSDNDEKGGGE